MEIDKVAYIKIQDGKILCSRSFGKKKFYIPGGKRDDNESDETCLIREVKEELNVEIDPLTIDYVGTFSAQADGKEEGVIVKMTCYQADYIGQLSASSEIEEIKWLNMKDIDLVSFVDVIIFNYLSNKGALE